MRSALALLSFAIACDAPVGPPRGHVFLHVDTDAPIDTGSRVASIDRPIPLFDRLRFDILPPNASDPCTGCTNEFAATSDAFDNRKVSIDIPLPPGQKGWTARVRLYPLYLAGADGEPDPDTAIDVTFTLPAVDVTGAVEASIVLHTDDVGKPTTIVPALGPPGPSVVNSWSGAKRPACGDVTHDGMVCVPGGAFWMGSLPADLAPATVPGWHRLVVVSPFFLDATEMTVARARPVIEANGYDPIPWTGSSTGAAAEDWCTYTHVPGPRDALPVTCIETIRARKICSQLVDGGDLPSEAQFEYVMGGLGMKRFVWGMDSPSCGDAIWGRNGVGFFSLVEPTSCLAFAMALGPLGGPEAPGSGTRDVLVLPGGAIHDLAGNVSEWARDWYQPYTGDCWSDPGILVDPYCATPNAMAAMREVDRGGSWGTGGVSLEAASRQSRVLGGVSPYDGFRCAVAAN